MTDQGGRGTHQAQRTFFLVGCILGAAALLLACSGDAGDDTTISESTTSTPNPTATTHLDERTGVAPRDGVKSPSATPTLEAELPGPQFPTLTLGDPAVFPTGITAFVLEGCLACDGPPHTLFRASRHDQQATSTTPLRTLTPARPLQRAWSVGEHLFVIECVDAICAQAELSRSVDAGQTWISAGTRAAPAGDGSWSAARWGLDGPPADLWRLDGSTGLLSGPTDETVDLAAIHGDGKSYHLGTVIVGERRIAMTWRVILSGNDGDEAAFYFTVWDFELDVGRTYDAPNLEPGPWLDESELFVRVHFSSRGGPGRFPPTGDFDEVALPAILDVTTGVFRPIVEPFARTPGADTIIGIY